MQCPKCNMNNNDETKFCSQCGYQFDNAQVAQETQKSNKNSTKLVISIVNLFIIAPLVFYFMAVWGIFGAFSNNSILYYGILIGGLVYFVFTIAFFISSLFGTISHTVEKNTNKKVFNISRIIIGIILVIIIIFIIINIISAFSILR